MKTKQVLKVEGKIHSRLFFAMFKKTFIPVIFLTCLIAVITLLVTLRLPANYTTTTILRYTPPAKFTSSPEKMLELHIKQLNAIEKVKAIRINHSYLINVSIETTTPVQSRVIAASMLNRYIDHYGVKTAATETIGNNKPLTSQPPEANTEFEVALTQLKSEILSQKTATSADTDLSIFQAPSYPVETTSKRNLLIVLTIALTCFSLCQIIIVITSRYRGKINTIDDVKSKLHTELIAVNLRRKNRCSSAEKAIIKRYSQHSLKQALLLNNNLKDKKILNLVSINPKEGTTVIAWQLAHALNQNKKILIIDLDINQHSRFINWLSSSLELRNSGNNSNQTRESNKIYNSTFKNIHVMPLDENHLLLSTDDDLQRLNSHLNNLKKTYDLILFDSPPLVKSQVALFAAKIADGTLLVLKPGRTSVRKIRRYLLQLLQNNGAVIGVIINKIGISTKIAKSLNLEINWDIR